MSGKRLITFTTAGGLMRRRGRWMARLALVLAAVGIAAAQEKKTEEKPKTLWEEITWFAYVENRCRP